MLKTLATNQVGPAPRFVMELGSRLNLITGDNGLGKSFLLDVAWFGLAGDWPAGPVLPSQFLTNPEEPKKNPKAGDVDNVIEIYDLKNPLDFFRDNENKYNRPFIFFDFSDSEIKNRDVFLFHTNMGWFPAVGRSLIGKVAASLGKSMELFPTYLSKLSNSIIDSSGISIRVSETGKAVKVNDRKTRNDFPFNPTPELALYVRADGGFSAADSARAPAKEAFDRALSHFLDVTSMHFSNNEIMDGKKDKNGQTICRGLLIDWRDWQTSDDLNFHRFVKVLEALSPPGELIRVAEGAIRLPGPSVDRVPVLEMPYGPVPITLASSAIKRIVSLAYLLVWLWVEHVQAARANQQPQQNQITVLIDEIETHLHPQWQRRILPALLDVGQALADEVQVQFIVTTHSPLVLASVEPKFDEQTDKLFHLDLVEGVPELSEHPWHKRGTVGSWLQSDIFNLAHDRSVPAEQAMLQAFKMMRREDFVPDDAVAALEEKLAELLPGTDPFWSHWYRFTTIRERNKKNDSGQASA